MLRRLSVLVLRNSEVSLLSADGQLVARARGRFQFDLEILPPNIGLGRNIPLAAHKSARNECVMAEAGTI